MKKVNKTNNSKINKKKIIILIMIIIAVIFEIVAFRNSRATKIFDVTAEIVDYDELLENEDIIVTAADGGASGYYITLPEYIGTKKVNTYIIEKQNLHNTTSEIEALANEDAENNQEVDEEQTKINSTENIVSEENTISSENKLLENANTNSETNNAEAVITSSEEYIYAGQTIYLTDEESESKTITIKVVYNSENVNGQDLYEQKIQTDIDYNEDGKTDNTIKIEGLMPLESSISTKMISVEEINDSLKDLINEKTSFKKAYDIKILYNDKEYEPTDFDTNVRVSIVGVDEIDTTTQKYKVVHIDDNNSASEVNGVKTKNDTITFTADSFSTYALLLEDAAANTYSADLSTASVWDGSIATGYRFGSGTASSPYLITSAEELAYLAQRVNAGTTYDGQYFQLITDINLNNNEWTPIGSYTYSFRGTFDGLGHTIANTTIATSTTLPTSILAYGFFGSIGGGSDTATIKNLQLDGFNIEITASGTTSTDTYTEKGYHIGIVAGTMFSKSTIKNVIVNSSNIYDDNQITVRNNATQVFIGGIAGCARNTTGSYSDPGTNNRYSIKNCYSNTNIDLQFYPRNGTLRNAGQYAVGGVIGGIRAQSVWPENCLYKGTINADYAFVGPIFGYLRSSTGVGSTTNFDTLWNGYDAGSTSMQATSYYSEYSVNGTSFTSSVTSGDSYEYIYEWTYMDCVQGVNKGIYTSNLNTMLANFNDYVSNNNSENYITWNYDSGTASYYFEAPLTGDVIMNSPEYIITPNDLDNTGTYTYSWYLNGTLNSGNTTDTATIKSSWTENYKAEVLIYNGEYYVMVSFSIPLLEIHIEFDINETTNTAVAIFKGTGTTDPDFNINDYIFSWYYEDVSGLNSTILDEETSSTLQNLEEGSDYKLTATNTKYDYMGTEGSFTYGDRTVIYVDSNNGSNYNDGLTPETAVRTMDTGFNKLPSSGSVRTNIVVVMGNYFNASNSTTNNELHNAAKQAFASAKAATITGIYKTEDYNAQIYIYGEDIVLGNDRVFQYLHFRGNTGTTYSGQCMMYAQGHSLTMGNGLYMDYFQNGNVSNHALVNTTSPYFHVLGGFKDYNLADLPSSNNNSTILIQSGTYARIIAGTRNTGNNGTSHNITGTEENPFNVKIIIDIEESTTPERYSKDINSISMGQTDGSIYANAELVVKKGIIGRIIGGNIGNTRTISGYSANSFWGSTKLSIYDGIIGELYGASLGRSQSDVYFYGSIELNIYGGTVQQSIYGAGAGGVTGYSVSSTDKYKDTGKDFNTSVKINITGGTIQGNVYGAGYGLSPYLSESTIASDGGTLYGDSYIDISGGTIKGNIYGGSKGYGYSSKKSLAQMYGNSNIAITGSPTITGAIYGAGEGQTTYPDTAKLTGITNVTIENDLINNTYGGGNASAVEGTTHIYVKTGNQTADIYGGGNVGPVNGTTNVYLYTGSNSTIVYGGGKSADATTTNVYLQGGTPTTIYGGSNTSGTIVQTNVELESGSVTTVYGANNAGGTVENSKVNLNGITLTDIYGGNNANGTANNTIVNINSGAVTNVYGGNNAGGTAENTIVNINGGTINGEIYGGGNRANSGTTNVNLVSATNKVSSIYGGGKSADATTTTVNCNGVNAASIFGGSNTTGAVTYSNLNTTAGTIDNVYGGNNLGGSNELSTINVKGGEISNVFGGGNKVEINTSNVNMISGKVTNIFGGGNETTTATTGTTNVNIYGGELTNAFGGANTSGDVTNSNINLSPLEMDIAYTAKVATWETTEYPTVVDITITYTNYSSYAITKWNSYIEAEGLTLFTNWSESKISQDGDKLIITEANNWNEENSNNIAANKGIRTVTFQAFSTMQPEEFSLNKKIVSLTSSDTSTTNNSNLTIYGGNNKGGTTNISNVNIVAGLVKDVYGGNNEGGTTNNSHVDISGGNIITAYGGNNLGGITGTSNIVVNGGIITDVYGGGNKALTNVTYVTVASNINGSVYGGGNEAGVSNNTNTEIIDAQIARNVYGGGNEGTVDGNTYVHVNNSILNDSLYAGGNGTTAVVLGNATATVEGTKTTVVNSVFGGGNQAATGTETTNNSTSVVNIVGGNIGKNVYGGANTSKVYGFTYVNIGYDAVGDNSLVLGDIEIGGTIFGGGESNAEGSEKFTYDFTSVTVGINININGNGHDKCVFKGSIFGSGNASSSAGYSYITIKNYGSVYNPQSNISIQRAQVVTLDNSAMMLFGTKDSTNDYAYANEIYGLNRIDELKLKNGSILYLNYGANIVKKLTSCVDINGVETKAEVIIDEETGVTRNVDNRIYMAQGKKLNIAEDLAGQYGGEVSGMTFFGIYTNTMSPSTSTGLYNREYNNGDEIINAGTFTNNSYVKGLKKNEHDITIDGFYSNYEEEDNMGFITTKYINPTEENNLYIWTIGIEVEVKEFEISLVASKFATRGTKELQLESFGSPNTKFILTGFSVGLINGISLVNPKDIENISIDPDTANEVFGLYMKSGNTGWQTNSSTYFLTENGGTYIGENQYNSDNSSYTPTLNFNFYHSRQYIYRTRFGKCHYKISSINSRE